MFSFIKNLFNRKTPKTSATENVIKGCVYALYNEKDKSNPFSHYKAKCYATVKDVKDGWVLYAIHPVGRGVFQNESMTVKEFLSIYKRV